MLDLLARGPSGERQRIAISRAMGPVWEANHVWLIFFITGLFSAFPTVFAAISTALFLPATLALVGIVLRGAAFAFRSHLQGADLVRSRLSAVFGITSSVTPFIWRHGRRSRTRNDPLPPRHDDLRRATRHLDRTLSDGLWGPGARRRRLPRHHLSRRRTDRAGDRELTAIFRVRALWSGAVAGGLSVVALALASADTARLYDRLTSTALPVVVLGVLAGTASLLALHSHRYRFARGASVLAVASVISGWGLAQYPQLAGPDLTITTAAAPHSVLSVLAIAGGAGMLLVIPSLWLLFAAFRRPPLNLEP